MRAFFRALTVFTLTCTPAEPRQVAIPAAPEESSTPDEPASVPPAEPAAPLDMPVCDMPEQLPEHIGDECAAGSNVDLCVMDVTDDCSGTPCLWHAGDPTGRRAYCTVFCQPAEPAACPASFSCLRDECDNLYVCVRTSVPVAEEPLVAVLPDVIPSAYGLTALGRIAGAAYWANSHREILRWTGAGSAEVIHQSDLSFRRPVAVQSGDVLLVVALLDDRLLRIEGTAVIEAALPVEVNAGGLFKTADDTVYLLEQEVFGAERRRMVPLDDELQRTTDEDRWLTFAGATHTPTKVMPLRGSGFVGTCKRNVDNVDLDCFSADGRVFGELPERALVETFRFSQTPEQLHGLVEADTGPIVTSLVAGTWVFQLQLADSREDVVLVFPLDAGQRIVLWGSGTPSGAFLSTQTCWQPLSASTRASIRAGDSTREDVLAWDASTLVWVDSQDVIQLSTDDFR